MINEQDIALIDAYLKDELSASEKKAFSSRLAKEPELQKELELISSIAAGYQRMELKKQMDVLEENFQQSTTAPANLIEPSSKSKGNYRLIAIAAGVAVLISAPLIINFLNTESTDEIPYGLPSFNKEEFDNFSNPLKEDSAIDQDSTDLPSFPSINRRSRSIEFNRKSHLGIERNHLEELLFSDGDQQEIKKTKELIKILEQRR